MKLKIQRRLAAKIMKCSESKVAFDSGRLEDIKEAITKEDIKSLIANKVIKKRPSAATSKARARKRKVQKRKGRMKGVGSKKGKAGARLSKKEAWINKIRVQRKFLKLLRDKKAITSKDFHELYKKSKGGFFRSKRHIKLYMEEHGFIKSGPGK